MSLLSYSPETLALVAGSALAAFAERAEARCDDPEPFELTAVETEGDPLDLPGRGPSPKTRSDVTLPAPVQSGARPETPPDPREWLGPGGRSWLEWSRATGDWGGTRTAMEEAGLTFAGSARIDWAGVTSGGVSGGGYSRRLVDVNLTLDLEAATDGAWKGGTVYADAYHYGGETGEPSGSIQGTDVITSSRSLDQLAEVWFQQTFDEGRWRVKMGKIDANAEFAVVECAEGFISANGVWDPALLDMPTYPDPAFGAVVFFTPSDSLYVGGGVFDGATHDGFPTGSRGPSTLFSDEKSSSWYFVAEAGVHWACAGGLDGTLAAGGWYHTGDYARFDGSTAEGTGGAYVMVQQQLVRRSEGEETEGKGLFAFARAAFADGDLAVIETRIAAGLVLEGAFGGRDDDSLGVMWSMAGLSDESGASGDEHIVEFYYSIAAAGSVAVKPFVQWVSNPGGVATLGDATLVGVSIEVSF